MDNLKTPAHSAPIENKETFQQRILMHVKNSKTPGTFERVQQSMIRSVHACNDSGGGYFEHLL
jgi:hypothetical protein